MEIATTLGIGLTLGSLLTWLVHRGELGYLREELKVAHAQIAHAVIQERALIPPRIEPVEPIKPLTKELQDCVDQWDEPESRAVEEAKIRGWLADDHSIKSILRQYGANP